ncbi:MAG TPA: hypothetical protein VMF89_30795, partial [Polyangiales bacterium]|nr:hypothetical protein [Polyangiales bacterium]
MAIALATGCGDAGSRSRSIDTSAGDAPDAQTPASSSPRSTEIRAADNAAGEVVTPSSTESAATQAPQSPAIELAKADAGAAAHPQPDAAAAADGVDTAAPAALGRESLGVTPLPCELRSALETSCQSCHARTPGSSAPMALTSREDLLGPAISQPERKVYELVSERIHSAAAPMPPVTSRRLTDSELATFDGLLSAELAAGPEQCGGTGAKRVAYPAPDPSEIEQCYPFYAYQRGSDGAQPFQVPTGENYACFVFDIPWPGAAQALSVKIRDSPVLHHWVLFDSQLSLPHGTVLVTADDCSLGATTMYASGLISEEDALNMPPSVGLQMPTAGSGLRMMLSVHYFNMGQPIDDSSGVEVCVAREPREHTAAPHNVGALDLVLPPRQATNIVTRCTPKYQGDIHIIKTQPHMHARGVRLDTIVERADGSRETLI